MPQELRVVCCFQCRKFQSDIVKKAKKWSCKMCGAKQSLVKEYARGSGRECRLLVQQLSEGSLQADQMERVVAEQVLSGKIELPVENPIREESERLVASHEANRKAAGGQGSKWDGFCAKEEDEESENLSGKFDVEKSQSSSWAKWGSAKVADQRFAVKLESSFSSKPRNSFEQHSTTSKLVPLADPHQMDKEDEQFRRQSTTYTTEFSSSASTQTIQEMRKPLFNFKPKALEEMDTPKFDGNIALKRTSDTEEHTASQSPMMSFAKKSKWHSFRHSELELNSSIVPSDQKECSQNPEKSSSKWTKYISQTDQEEDEFS